MIGDSRNCPVHTYMARHGNRHGKPYPRKAIPMSFNTEKYVKSPFLKGEDLEEGERLVVTIKSAEEVNFPSGDTVPVLEFMELDQKLTLNKTRVKKLVELLGDDTDAWIDRKIALYPIDVSYNGKTTLGVAVAAAPKKKAAPTQPEVKFMADDDEASPF